MELKNGIMDVLPLYFNEHIVKHFEIDASGRFSLAALANLVQEDAAEHARRLKVGYRDLLKNNLAWMMARARFRFLGSPELGKNIETETWVKDHDRMFSYRDFHFKFNEEVFAVVNTAWLIANIETKKMISPEEYIKYSFKLKNRCLVNDEIPKLKGVEGQAEHVFMHKVKFSNIDLNHHVNNVSYLQWYLDYIPNDVALYPLNELVVNYLHEVRLNDKVNIYYDIKPGDNLIHVTCEMVNAATDQPACRIEAIHQKHKTSA